MQQGHHPVPIFPAVEDGIGGGSIVEQKLHVRHSQHDVLQRRGVEAQFRVLYLRVHDDHVVGLYGKQLSGKIELPLAAEAVKQFRTGVGVGGTVPVATEPALADVQQPERFPWGGSVPDIKALGAHKTILPSESQKS